MGKGRLLLKLLGKIDDPSLTHLPLIMVFCFSYLEENDHIQLQKEKTK